LKELLSSEEALIEWLESATEVICVDSHSTDGTREWLLEFCANHPNACLIDHPPGLYSSWNSGLSRSTGEWIHIATAGDTFLPNGGEHLLEIGEAHVADLVISPPQMLYSDLQSAQIRWPVHDMIETLCDNQSVCELALKDKIFWFFFFLPSTAIGSSASNIYRGSFLRSRPFPTIAGQAGDSLWAIQNVAQARVILTSEQCARFIVSKKSNGKEESALKQAALFKTLVECANAVLYSYKPNAADRKLLDSIWNPQLELWDWLASLEQSETRINHVLNEQLSYISTLEHENKRLHDEVERLGKIPFTELMPPIKMHHLSALMRAAKKMLK
jgi:glycosyltransferase involved in cell wall biosynthesis